jgi:hypothetical protein
MIPSYLFPVGAKLGVPPCWKNTLMDGIVQAVGWEKEHEKLRTLH